MIRPILKRIEITPTGDIEWFFEGDDLAHSSNSFIPGSATRVALEAIEAMIAIHNDLNRVDRIDKLRAAMKEPEPGPASVADEPERGLVSLRALREQYPTRLVFVLRNPPANRSLNWLATAAEEAGQLPEARDALLTLLDHESPLVQEGAVRGLAKQIDSALVRVKFEAIAHDPCRSKGVLIAVRDALDDADDRRTR